ncbi:hypothetical protein LTR10_021648 [Elasticomyces elasticus]|uniref:Septin-type G domain-containing protein n=1 Tax=Exophiala sideris TaxID=1016849 RepID=A0ABR0J926_9EURO|nr:hypothetical protein LTR10_021648 [Elasticomyces elasticus]KAK5037353.1 hypothetical protein LTR13_004509 [Exophiala sideris]KAK5059017.1 hypothetical protein LTR69_006304 [Exophiala sideris]KAK5182849.1 hypothetical protein LTR44_004557 [Eurotiomycetes sp. CCFEE 6388]
MRPGIGFENSEPRPRKPSTTDPPLTSDRSNAAPTTFFLSRDPDGSRPQTERGLGLTSSTLPVGSLQEAIQDSERSGKQAATRTPEVRSASRRRSTIRPGNEEHLRRTSSTTHPEASQPLVGVLTASPLPSRDVSLPSSPKSGSSRSLHRSDDESTNDETGSQAIGSSGEEEEEEPGAVIHDSQPELIMPSIKMPSRRPFTSRGKRLGWFKILVAGRKGVGKTSLIKSVVQLCEDIVHVDSVSTVSSRTSRHDSRGSSETVNEIYASTKPYPAWWSNVEESRILRRRKSMGDSVLERNICFVDTSDSIKLDRIIQYAEEQLTNVMTSVNHLTNEFSSLLSGRGSSQVDVILYLISKEHLGDDCERIRQLSELCSIVPLVAKSDLLSTEEQEQIKQAIDLSFVSLPRLPPSLLSEPEHKATATAPYTITSTNGPDLDTMDASLLMSPEYIQPLLPSQLSLLVEHIFDPETVAYLRHTSARKLMAWYASHPKLTSVSSPSLPSVLNSTLGSPFPTSLSNSGILIPPRSEMSLNTSNSWALARVADHTQREERLAQVRLSKWASELQLSLQRERERYEKIARVERATWLVEKMGEEVRDGRIQARDNTQALIRNGEKSTVGYGELPSYKIHDPLGLLRWQNSVRTRGWIALQIMGSFGVLGGLAFWVVKTWGLTTSINDWAQGYHMSWFGHD